MQCPRHLHFTKKKYGLLPKRVVDPWFRTYNNLWYRHKMLNVISRVKLYRISINNRFFCNIPL